MEVSPCLLQSLVARGLTYKEISEELQQTHHQRRGLSARSVRRQVKELGLKAAIQQDTQEAVHEAVDEVRIGTMHK